MSEQETQQKSVAGGVLLGFMIALLIIVVLGLGYFIYNSSVNPADQFGTDFYHKYTYSHSVKQCGKRFLNVKWPMFTDSSWNFKSVTFNGQNYVAGTCKVTAEGDPEKIDVYCIFQIKGRTVSDAFFAAGEKIYYDGLSLTHELLEEIFSEDTSYDDTEPVDDTENIDAIRDAYKTVLRQRQSDHIIYYVADINKDGTPELILQEDPNEVEYETLSVYTYENGLKDWGRHDFPFTDLVKLNDDIYFYYHPMGDEGTLYSASIRDGQLDISEVITDNDLTYYEDRSLPSCNKQDLSAIDNYVA